MTLVFFISLEEGKAKITFFSFFLSESTRVSFWLKAEKDIRIIKKKMLLVSFKIFNCFTYIHYKYNADMIPCRLDFVKTYLFN